MKKEELRLKLNFLILTIILITVGIIPGVSRTAKIYSATFIFGLIIGECITAINSAVDDIVNKMKNVLKSFAKKGLPTRIIILFIYFAAIAYAVYALYVVSVFNSLIMKLTQIPWWLMLLGIGFNMSVSLIWKKIPRNPEKI
jgi:ABC-type arginine transport system permease subunit